MGCQGTLAHDLYETLSKTLGGPTVLKRGIATLRRMLQAIDIAQLERQLGDWLHTQSLANEPVALDGKTLPSRRAMLERHLRTPSHLTRRNGRTLAACFEANTAGWSAFCAPATRSLAFRRPDLYAESLMRWNTTRL